MHILGGVSVLAVCCRVERVCREREREENECMMSFFVFAAPLRFASTAARPLPQTT
jgi:hypothetical protein